MNLKPRLFLFKVQTTTTPSHHHLKNVDLKEVSRQCITYKADVNVSNPYITSIPICEISYTFKSADRVIAEGSIPDPGSLKANADTMLDVGVKVPHSVLMSLMKDIGADWDIDYELNIILTVDLPVVGNINIPVNSKGEQEREPVNSGFPASFVSGCYSCFRRWWLVSGGVVSQGR